MHFKETTRHSTFIITQRRRPNLNTTWLEKFGNKLLENKSFVMITQHSANKHWDALSVRKQQQGMFKMPKIVSVALFTSYWETLRSDLSSSCRHRTPWADTCTSQRFPWALESHRRRDYHLWFSNRRKLRWMTVWMKCIFYSRNVKCTIKHPPWLWSSFFLALRCTQFASWKTLSPGY